MIIWRTHHGWFRQEKIWKREIPRLAKNLLKSKAFWNKIPWLFPDFWGIYKTSLTFPGFPWHSLKTASFPGFQGFPWPLGILSVQNFCQIGQFLRSPNLRWLTHKQRYQTFSDSSLTEVEIFPSEPLLIGYCWMYVIWLCHSWCFLRAKRAKKIFPFDFWLFMHKDNQFSETDVFGNHRKTARFRFFHQ